MRTIEYRLYRTRAKRLLALYCLKESRASHGQVLATAPALAERLRRTFKQCLRSIEPGAPLGLPLVQPPVAGTPPGCATAHRAVMSGWMSGWMRWHALACA